MASTEPVRTMQPVPPTTSIEGRTKKFGQAATRRVVSSPNGSLLLTFRLADPVSGETALAQDHFKAP